MFKAFVYRTLKTWILVEAESFEELFKILRRKNKWIRIVIFRVEKTVNK